MKRNVTETLERGFRNTLANWPLLLLKIAGTIVTMMIVVVAIVASIVPIAVSLGLADWKMTSPDDAAELLADLVLEHWPMLLIIVAVMTLALTIVVAVVAFVDAGATQVLIDGDRRAPNGSTLRAEYEAFTIDRWLHGGKENWWSVFWIYNLAWTVAGAVLLVPLVLTLGGILATGENAAAIAVGCVGLALTALVGVVIAILTALWVRKAIVIAVARDLGAVAALGASAGEVMSDFARHFAVAFVLTALSFGVSGVASVFSMIGSLDQSGMASVAMIPMQLGLSVVSGVAGAAITMWLTASFTSLTVEV